MMNKNFVSIITCFKDTDKRNLTNLSLVYENVDLLEKIVMQLFTSEFCKLLPGKSILLKPNWVKECINGNDSLCLHTNLNIIIAVLRIMLRQGVSRVVIGDSPIQGCHLEKLLFKDWIEKVGALAKEYNTPVLIKDFRRKIYCNSAKVQSDLHSMENYVIVDIGKKSYLEQITSTEEKFRIGDYDYKRLTEMHQPGIHKFTIAREVFESDVIISMPKIKTHQKTGITAALKNIVGTVGDKDCLPHHRIGSLENNGDCYPKHNIFRTLGETILDLSAKRLGHKDGWILKKISSICWRLSLPTKLDNRTASWYGNDTCWRMVMDLNTALIYGKVDGSISMTPQRVLYSLCDGIIAGQGNGPLTPDPLPLGIMSFSNHSALNDICMAMLMGLDYKKIPLLKAASKIINNEQSSIILNGNHVSYTDLQDYSIQAKPADGWMGYIEQNKK